MDIIMVRHGESEDNILKIFGRNETPLSKKGIEQIKHTKKILENHKFSKVYYSSLRRTRETLKILELEGISENRIKELDFGIFTGYTYEEFSAKYPLEAKEWVDDPYNYVIPQGESIYMVYNRLKEFLEDIVKSDEDVLLITHEGIIRLGFCWVLDNPDLFFKFKAQNGSINIISVEDGYKYISKLNYK